MTKQELEEIKERAERATPAPWYIGHVNEVTDACEIFYTDGERGLDLAKVYNRNDQAFIANARTDIPKLVQVLEVAVEALKKAANQVTWVDEKNQKVILTYGFHVESCQKALEKIGWEE